ncbi:sensor histidine kinase [Pseudogulbenkiania ferrooxidans]|uniref:histidine kinase n=1 Tax=Pseudogulbenkiania ferrooxidans 2002 TaxID=279714 RepID=B9Z6I5_9NEIS|nr:HAMP domain-containing sensor histidine kinase [Pseudogulbenkiania ferrooxidans]EEG07560.1 integral membrane sensor signal transduction histidine kinase [Pseudogulbenkiania ferrooxidans 2002]
MRTFTGKLAIWLLGGATLLLTGLGVVCNDYSRRQDQSEYMALRKSLTHRLELTLPHGVWQLDEPYLRQLLDAELAWSAVEAIRIQGDAGLNLGRIRDGRAVRDMTPADQPPADDRLSFAITYLKQEQLAQATVYLSRESLRLKEQQRRLDLLLQVLLLDGGLWLLLRYALQRHLRQSLDQLQQQLEKALVQSAPEPAADNTGAISQEFAPLLDSARRLGEQRRLDLVTLQRADARAQEEKQRAQQAFQQLELAQQTLEESENLATLGRLGADVAHEINTPIGVTLSTASSLANTTHYLTESLNAGTIKKSEFLDYLAHTEESCQLLLSSAERAADLVHSFRQIAQDQTGETRRQFPLTAYLEEIVRNLKPQRESANLDIELHGELDVLMDSYPGALFQVVSQLLENATLHAFQAGQRGRIRLESALRDERHVRISISDSGCGIAPENLDRVFEPFFTTRGGQEHRGLGLYLANSKARQPLGGTLTVTSQPGQGSVFTLDIPCQAPF